MDLDYEVATALALRANYLQMRADVDVMRADLDASINRIEAALMCHRTTPLGVVPEPKNGSGTNE